MARPAGHTSVSRQLTPDQFARVAEKYNLASWIYWFFTAQTANMKNNVLPSAGILSSPAPYLLRYFSSRLLLVALLCLSLPAIAQYKQGETISLDSKYFKDKREIRVYLPNGYQNAPNRSYKVIYLFDAQNNAYVDYLVSTCNYLSELSYTFMSPCIIVGIKTRNRQFEFLPKNTTQQPYKDYFPQVKLGGADTLIASLQEEIMPEIDKRYRTNHYNIAIGHSLGATFSLYSLIKAPKLFNAAIAISPNLYYDDNQILRLFKAQWEQLSLQQKFLYVLYGKEGKLESRFYPASQDFQQFLSRHDKPGFFNHVEFLDNNDHAMTRLAGIHRGLQLLNKQLVIDETADDFYTRSNPSFVDELKRYYAKQSAQTGLQLPTVEDINHIAYNLYYSQKGAEAIQVATWSLALYPDDINAYDSLGEMLAGNKKQGEATVILQQGLELIEKQKDQLTASAYNSLKEKFQKKLAGLSGR